MDGTDKDSRQILSSEAVKNRQKTAVKVITMDDSDYAALVEATYYSLTPEIKELIDDTVRIHFLVEQLPEKGIVKPKEPVINLLADNRSKVEDDFLRLVTQSGIITKEVIDCVINGARANVEKIMNNLYQEPVVDDAVGRKEKISKLLKAFSSDDGVKFANNIIGGNIPDLIVCYLRDLFVAMMEYSKKPARLSDRVLVAKQEN